MADEPSKTDQALNDLAALSPDERAAVEQLAEAPKAAPSDPVTVTVAWPTDHFDSGVANVGVLTREPTEISQSDLAAVLKAARTAGVNLIQGS